MKWVLRNSLLILLLPVAVLASACLRERPSDKPPIHINPNMDSQPKYKAYRQSQFFADQSDMRQPVAGTVAVGSLKEDSRFYFGKEAGGAFVKRSPVSTTMELLSHGQERFNIYCAPCHSRVGDGKGIVVQRGMLPPPSFQDPRLVAVEDGYLFDVMSNGIRNMPSYRHQIPVADRWAIVSYVRALQRSQNARLGDVPQDKQAELQAGGK